MNKSRAARCLACFALLFAVLGGLLASSVVFAAEQSDNGSVSLPPAQEEPPSEEPIKVASKFPSLEGTANEVFNFEVIIQLTDEYLRKYEFNVITPPGWEAGVWGGYPKKLVTSIDFAGESSLSETIEVHAFSTLGKRTEPGEYVITFEIESVESPDIKASVDLIAVVTASYGFSMFTETGRLNAETQAGEDNHVSILLFNTGTAAIEDITLSSTAPADWDIIFDPEKIDSLEPDLERTIDVVIRPPEKTIAGDYLVTLKADSERGSDSLEMRVTVLTSTLWGWAGIGITAGVISGLVVLFRRLGRR